MSKMSDDRDYWHFHAVSLGKENDALRAENERLVAELAKSKLCINELEIELEHGVTCWCENCESTQKENERLREALGLIEWITPGVDENDNDVTFCPRCDETPDSGHKSGCELHAVLGDMGVGE